VARGEAYLRAKFRRDHTNEDLMPEIANLGLSWDRFALVAFLQLVA